MSFADSFLPRAEILIRLEVAVMFGWLHRILAAILLRRTVLAFVVAQLDLGQEDLRQHVSDLSLLLRGVFNGHFCAF